MAPPKFQSLLWKEDSTLGRKYTTEIFGKYQGWELLKASNRGIKKPAQKYSKDDITTNIWTISPHHFLYNN